LNETLVSAAFYLDAHELKSVCKVQNSPATLLACNFAADRSAPEENLATTAVAASKFLSPTIA
jgi:hypothetical protein